MSKPPLILVTGATGALGPCIVAELIKAGYLIRTLSLNPPKKRIWPDIVETRTGDITNEKDVQNAMEGVKKVVHLAALLHIPNPPLALYEKYKKVNVEGTDIIVKTAQDREIERLVFFSTISVYGPSNGKILTEDSPVNPDSFYAKTKVEAEGIVLSAKRKDHSPLGTVLRLGAVYGAHIKGNYKRLFNAIKKGYFLPIGSGENRRSLIYEKDVAQATLLALEHVNAAGRIYNVTDGAFHTMNEIISTIYEVLGKKPPFFKISEKPVRLIARIIENLTKVMGFSTFINCAMVDKITEDVAVDSTRIRKELGFLPQYDLLSGWKETVFKMKRACLE